MPVSTKNFKPGEVLFAEGEPANSLFIIRKGAVSIRKMKTKTYIEVAKAAANEVLGELAFFDRQPRSATAVALIDVEAIEITFDSMEKIYASMPDYMKTIVAAMAERLRKANEIIRTMQQKDS